MLARLRALPAADRAAAAYARAREICELDVATNRAIGEHGLPLFQAAFEKAGGKRRLNVLTHCNAGWLATVDWGTALAPIYRAREAGISEERAAKEIILAPQPTKEFVTVEQIAAMALYLAGDAAAQINGASFAIDGGGTAR